MKELFCLFFGCKNKLLYEGSVEVEKEKNNDIHRENKGSKNNARVGCVKNRVFSGNAKSWTIWLQGNSRRIYKSKKSLIKGSSERKNLVEKSLKGENK
jgi:pyocin large subunit-like protein